MKSLIANHFFTFILPIFLVSGCGSTPPQIADCLLGKWPFEVDQEIAKINDRVVGGIDEDGLGTYYWKTDEYLKSPKAENLRKENFSQIMRITNAEYQLALEKLLQKRLPNYDKDREGHYNLISALHKSLRGSDPDAGLYWLARMVVAGEDMKYILRRLTRFASEDVGLADPQALVQAINAWNSYERLGSPEGDLAVAGLVVYLATAPKSVGVYKAWKQAVSVAQQSDSLMPPKHILNAPTKLMSDVGYGKGYQYDPDTKDGFSGQEYFPDEIGHRTFYHPAQRGFEREIQKRIDYWNDLRKKKNSP